MTGQTDVWQSFVTGGRVRTCQLPIGRYEALLGLVISLIDGQGSLRTVGFFFVFGFCGHDAKYVHVVQKPNVNPNMIGVHNPSTAQYNKGDPSLNDIKNGVSGTDTAPRILYFLTVL